MDNKPLLKIVAWNAGGRIYDKKSEIEHFLHEHNVDILLISETLLKNSWKFKIQNYTTYKNRRDDTARGTAVLIKSNISHYEYPLNLDTAEATANVVKIQGNELAIVSIYNSPSLEFHKNNYDKVFKIAPSVISAGDFNSKHTSWGSRANNARGKKLFEYTLDKNLSVHAPNDFTYFPHNHKHRPDILDISVCKNISSIISVNTVRELDSDHYPIEITLDREPIVTSATRYQTTKADWKKYETYLQTHTLADIALTIQGEIDQAITQITELIHNGLTVLCPSQENSCPKRSLPKHILDKIKSRNRMRARYHRTPDLFLKNNINRAQKEIAREVKLQ